MGLVKEVPITREERWMGQRLNCSHHNVGSL